MGPSSYLSIPSTAISSIFANPIENRTTLQYCMNLCHPTLMLDDRTQEANRTEQNDAKTEKGQEMNDPLKRYDLIVYCGRVILVHQMQGLHLQTSYPLSRLSTVTAKRANDQIEDLYFSEGFRRLGQEYILGS